MKIIKLCLTAALLLYMGVTSLKSQDIETLWDIEVTTASKQEEKISDAPGIISVVSKQEIEGYGALSLGNVINRITSMYFMHGSVFFWNLASVRGQYTSSFDNHVLILVNGRPMRDGMSGGINSIIYNGFPLDVVDHIEVIRGPGSVLYGTNAFSGVINIITSKPKEKSAYNANVQYGSLNTFTQAVSGNVFFNENANINFGLQNYMDDGPEFEFWDSPIPLTPTYTYPPRSGKGKFSKSNQSAFLNANYKGFHYSGFYNYSQPFTLALPFNWELTSPPFPDGNKAGDEVTKYNRFFSDLGYNHEFNDKYSAEVNVTYNYILANGHVDNDDDPDAIKAESSNILAELAFKAKPVENMNLILGGLYDFNTFGGDQMIDGDLSKFNTYLQADYKLVDWLKLIAGAQLNKSENIDANISPRVGAVANITDNWGTKVLYSTAFRDAYPLELVPNHPSYISNELLEPELISTTDIQVFYQNENMQTSLTYYFSHMTDLIKTVPDAESGKFQFQNIGEFDFQGIEFEGNFKLPGKFSLNSSVTYQTNENDEGTEDAAYWPNLIVKAGILYKDDIYSAGIYNSYFGEPRQVPDPPVSLNPEVKAYNLLTANVSADIIKVFKLKSKLPVILSVFADNLIDEDIWFPDFTRQAVNSVPLHAGRTLYGKVTVKF